MTMSGSRRIAYITLQSTREGQAAHAHVHEIIGGLESLGWQVVLYAARTAHGSGILRRLISFVWTQLKLMLFIRRYHALYVRWHVATFFVVLWAKAWRVPVCMEVNGTYSDLFLVYPSMVKFKRALTWMMRAQLRYADARITVADLLAEWVETEAQGRSCEVIPNGADPELFRPEPDAQPVVDETYVVFVGALSPWQGVDTMLAATMSDYWPDGVKFLLAGDGSERTHVIEAALQTDRIRYLGTVPYKDVPGLLAHSLVALSVQGGALAEVRRDFSAIKVYEALACGVPVIVTPFPSQKRLIEEGKCGAVIPFDDSDALAQAIAFFHDNPRIREEMGKRARQVIETEHTWNCRAQATASVLEPLIKVAR